MTHKDGQKLPSYTHQSARDDKFGVVTAVQTTRNGDTPADLEKMPDQSIENTQGIHEQVTADCGFCNYEMLVKAEEERPEDIHLPDRRMGSSKEEETGSRKYQQEAFKRDTDGTCICPNGLKMELKTTVEYRDCHTVNIYRGTGCGDCPRKEKCCSGKERTLSVDSGTPYRDRMREKLSTPHGREIYRKRQGLIGKPSW